jgi:hypothetical protein
MKADSAPGKKAEKARQSGNADKRQLSASSTYYHPLSPVLNQIDHPGVIDFGSNPLYVVYDSISWQTSQTEILAQHPGKLS